MSTLTFTWARLMVDQPILWILVPGFALGLVLIVGGLVEMWMHRARAPRRARRARIRA
jgi:hypothetical protein